MLRIFRTIAVVGLVVSAYPLAAWSAGDISGHYLEARTCQVYTGPCFANAEVGLMGKNAMMAWSVDKGSHNGVNLSGLKVVMVVKGSHTLGFGGLSDSKQLKSVLLVDKRATPEQREALIQFAKTHGGAAGKVVGRVDVAPIEMSLDVETLSAKLQAGKVAKLITRKARPDDCICSNESAYYPPLAKVEHFAPGVTVEGRFSGRGLKSRWSIPDSRTAYMATFKY